MIPGRPGLMTVLALLARRPSLCMCGHVRDAHEHYRTGTECALCDDCPRWRGSRRNTLRWLRGKDLT